MHQNSRTPRKDDRFIEDQHLWLRPLVAGAWREAALANSLKWKETVHEYFKRNLTPSYFCQMDCSAKSPTEFLPPAVTLSITARSGTLLQMKKVTVVLHFPCNMMTVWNSSRKIKAASKSLKEFTSLVVNFLASYELFQTEFKLSPFDQLSWDAMLWRYWMSMYHPEKNSMREPIWLECPAHESDTNERLNAAIMELSQQNFETVNISLPSQPVQCTCTDDILRKGTHEETKNDQQIIPSSYQEENPEIQQKGKDKIIWGIPVMHELSQTAVPDNIGPSKMTEIPKSAWNLIIDGKVVENFDEYDQVKTVDPIPKDNISIPTRLNKVTQLTRELPTGVVTTNTGMTFENGCLQFCGFNKDNSSAKLAARRLIALTPSEEVLQKKSLVVCQDLHKAESLGGADLQMVVPISRSPSESVTDELVPVEVDTTAPSQTIQPENNPQNIISVEKMTDQDVGKTEPNNLFPAVEIPGTNPVVEISEIYVEDAAEDADPEVEENFGTEPAVVDDKKLPWNIDGSLLVKGNKKGAFKHNSPSPKPNKAPPPPRHMSLHQNEFLCDNLSGFNALGFLSFSFLESAAWLCNEPVYRVVETILQNGAYKFTSGAWILEGQSTIKRLPRIVLPLVSQTYDDQGRFGLLRQLFLIQPDNTLFHEWYTSDLRMVISRIIKALPITAEPYGSYETFTEWYETGHCNPRIHQSLIGLLTSVTTILDVAMISYNLGIAFSANLLYEITEQGNLYTIQDTKLTSTELSQFYVDICGKFPQLVVIVDPFTDNDVIGYDALHNTMDGKTCTVFQSAHRSLGLATLWHSLVTIKPRTLVTSCVHQIKQAQTNGKQVLLATHTGLSWEHNLYFQVAVGASVDFFILEGFISEWQKSIVNDVISFEKLFSY